MSRRCHQEGHVRLRDDVKRPYWQGLYRARSEDQPGGKWKSEKLGYEDEITKRQAQRRLQKTISKMESEIVRTPRAVMTVKTYIEDHYIPEFVNKRKPGTRRGYLQILKAHMLPVFGAMELDQVTRRDVQLLINRLHDQRKARHTCDNVRNVIRSLFRQATRDELFKSLNPAALIEMPPKDPKIPVAVPSAKRVCALLDAVEPEFQMLTWFVAATACRIGEALGLKWGAINFEDKLVWFLTARYLGEEHLTKGHRSQEPVVLMGEEIARLREYKARRPQATEEDLVFPHPKDPFRAMIDDLALSALQRAGVKVGLHVTWHQLRHWGASMLYRAGVPIKVIQKRLGHSKYQTTADWYIERDPKAARQAAKIQSELLAGWTKKHPANVAVSVAVNGVKSSSVDVSC
ncbi:MAG: site-specific integrase [Syntrophorhabdales bacterium]